MPTVSFIRDECRDRGREWRVVRDAVAGEQAVKRRGVTYLPKPSPEDNSRENLARYHSYRDRAVFYGVTGRTVRGMVGQVFSRPPLINVPPALSFMVNDVTGLGVSITQQAKQAVAENVTVGRAGLLSDFPNMSGQPVTVAMLAAGIVAPTITLYKPEDIINWRYKTSGGTTFLTLVVLKEKYTKEVDMFATKEHDRWRVLRIDDSGGYVSEVWYGESGRNELETTLPTTANGERLNYIPFDFIGCENNSPDVDYVPAYDLASINIAHYRNSADRERSGYILGEPTVVVSGLNEQWLKNVLKGVIALGTAGGIPLPAGAAVTLLEATPNTLVGEMMKDKERQMVALGAQLVQQSDVQRTATEARNEDSAKTSTLSTAADNTSAAYRNALATCDSFVSVTPSKMEFQLNTLFSINALDAAGRVQLIKEWQAEALTFGEMRAALRQAGLATELDDVALEKIAKEVAARGADREEESAPITEPQE